MSKRSNRRRRKLGLTSPVAPASWQPYYWQQQQQQPRQQQPRQQLQQAWQLQPVRPRINAVLPLTTDDPGLLSSLPDSTTADRIDLATMHTYCRPHGSPADDAFRDRYILSLPGAAVDAYGNIRITIGDGLCPILWSCHTDTVHQRSGRQRVHVSAGGRLNVHRTIELDADCLGADDTVGVWLLLQLIKAGRPGTYVFHYGEESGCIGSSSLAADDPDWLRQFRIAIAFDRRGTGDIITHQCGRRTASDAFAVSLASQLNLTDGLSYGPDNGGIFTDTEQYADIVPECTNVSVGYYSAHSSREYVDTDHVLRLRDALLSVDLDALTVARDPQQRERLARRSFAYAASPDDPPLCPLCGFRWSCTCNLPRPTVARSSGRCSGNCLDVDTGFTCDCGLDPWADADDTTVISNSSQSREPDPAYLDAVFADVQADLQRRLAKKGSL